MKGELMKATHNKTSGIYYIDDVIIDTTNELEPEEACKVLYHDLQGKRFVREAHEFLEKFQVEEGFNVLSKACWGMIEAIKDYEHKKANAVAPVPVEEPPKPKIKTYVRVENSDNDCEDCMLEGTTECNCYNTDECSCNSKKEYIGEMIDIDIYNTYRQTVENRWYVPLSIVKLYAYTQLKELFTRRCSVFDIVKKEYDNATNDYFLLGYRTYSDFPKNPCQVCRIPFEVFEAILNALEEREKEDDQFFED